MRLLYHGQLGFYVSSIFMIIFWEIRRRDFAVMFSHHIATALLIGASLHYRCGRWARGCRQRHKPRRCAQR